MTKCRYRSLLCNVSSDYKTRWPPSSHIHIPSFSPSPLPSHPNSHSQPPPSPFSIDLPHKPPKHPGPQKQQRPLKSETNLPRGIIVEPPSTFNTAIFFLGSSWTHVILTFSPHLRFHQSVSPSSALPRCRIPPFTGQLPPWY